MALINGELDIRNKTTDDLNTYLRDNGYDALPNYEYLTKMHCSSMTSDKVEALKKESDRCEIALQKAKDSTPLGMWIEELKQLTSALDAYHDAKKVAAGEDLHAFPERGGGRSQGRGRGRGRGRGK